jgi:hypothetical protein
MQPTYGETATPRLLREQTGRAVVRKVMGLPASVWQFVLMTVFSLLAAHLIAAAILNWSISTRRRRSPVREWAQRRMLQRLARVDAAEPTSATHV